MASRPNMHAKDSSGKQVSLLNEDSAPLQESRPVFRNPQYAAHTSMVRSNSNTSGMSTASSPRTPGLLRSDSYDSQTTNDPVSPITPIFMTDYGRQSSYTSAGILKGAAPPQYEERSSYEYPYPSNPHYTMPVQTPFADSRTSSYPEPHTYDEDPYGSQNASERGAKRYPCRFRDSHHCEKTFTTSGHASRHSKIHTAEKAVHCTFSGCQKKFTRADNMKQHLETHYKNADKRSSTSHKSSKSALTAPAGIKKALSSSRSSRPPSRNLNQAEYPPYDPALYAGSTADRYSMAADATHSAATSPIASYGALDMRGVHSALLSRPMPGRTENSSGGLDVLANIAACQPQN